MKLPACATVLTPTVLLASLTGAAGAFGGAAAQAADVRALPSVSMEATVKAAQIDPRRPDSTLTPGAKAALARMALHRGLGARGLRALVESLLTPVLYPLSAVPAKYHWIVFLNPLAGVVQAFKWGVLGIEELNRNALAIDAALVAVVLLSGWWYFARVEGQTVDRI